MHPKKRAFLACYSETGNITVACSAAGIGRTTYYRWTEHDAEFSAALAVAREEAADRLEEHARAWATVGVQTVKEIYEKGVLVRREVSRELSPTLLIFLLKGLKPEKYREHVAHEVSGPGGGPIPVQTFEYDAALASLAAGPVEDRLPPG